MIELHRTEDLTKDDFFNFDFSKSSLSTFEIGKLKKIEGVAFYFKNDPDSVAINEFLKRSLLTLLPDHKIYFLFFEKFPARKSRIRSHQKLFKKTVPTLGEKNLTELEVEVREEQSVLSALITLSSDNIDFVLTSLITSLFSFGYIVEKGSRSFKTNKENFLRKIVLSYSSVTNSKLHTNYLKLTSHITNENSAIFRLVLDGRNNQIFEFLGTEFKVKNLSSKLESGLGKNFYLKK